MPEYEHKTLGVKLFVKDNVTQGDLEKYAAEYRNFDHTGDIEHRGAVVRAMWKVGIIIEPTQIGDVAEMDPKVIRWMSEKLDAYYKELTTIPPE